MSWIPPIGRLERIAHGLSWPECPRWHDGALYLSDMYAGRVIRVRPRGPHDVILDISGIESEQARTAVGGLGFLRDGTLLAASMFAQRIYAVTTRGTEVFADLRDIAVGPINDLLVDLADNVFVSQLGSDVWSGEEHRPSHLIHVRDGFARDAEDAGVFLGANGMALADDGSTLVVAETFANRVWRMSLDPSGVLAGRQLVAEVESLPDGLCVDASNRVWVAQPFGKGLVRMSLTGDFEFTVPIDRRRHGGSIACAIGGPEGDTLFVCCGYHALDIGRANSELSGSVWAGSIARSGVQGGPSVVSA